MGSESPIGAVFLSYASQDVEAARRICDALRAGGIEVWLDQSDLRGGDAWDRQIRKQIHDCTLFIPIISAASQARLEGYFRLEWRLAVERTHLMADRMTFLIPVVIDGTTDQDAEVPDAFRAVQWTRLRGGETPPAFVERVIRLLSPSSTSASTHTHPSAAAPATRQAARRSAARRWALPLSLLAALTVAIIGVGYLALDRFVLAKRSTAGVPSTAVTVAAGVPEPVAIPDKSIAVLPFVNMSSDKEQDYFSDGLAEELLNMLTQVADLKVAARTSSFYFKGKQATISDIARTLGVAHVLEGSVRKAANKLRVTVQLIRADNGFHLWSRTYDRDVADIFKVQDEIAADVVATLKVKFLPTQQLRNLHRSDNPEAYAQYLLGRQLYFRVSPEGNRRAIEAFDRALALDPNYAAAMTGRVEAVANLRSDSGMPRASPEALEVLKKVLALAPELSDGYSDLGMARLFAYEWNDADTNLKKAIALSPGDSIAVRRYGYFLGSQGRFAEAIEAIKRAQSLDPLDAYSLFYLGLIHAGEGQYPAAHGALQRALEISPTHQRAFRLLAVVEVLEGRAQDAAAICQRLTLEWHREACEASTEHALGHTVRSQQVLAKLVRTDSADGVFAVAGVYAMQGDATRAFEWLDHAYARCSEQLAFIKTEPALISLHGDPRYKALLRRMKLPG